MLTERHPVVEAEMPLMRPDGREGMDPYEQAIGIGHGGLSLAVPPRYGERCDLAMGPDGRRARHWLISLAAKKRPLRLADRHLRSHARIYARISGVRRRA